MLYGEDFFCRLCLSKGLRMFRLWKNMYMSEWIYVYRHSAICIYM